MNAQYSFDISVVDTKVAFECEADRAEKEGFRNVADNQRKTALHLENAVHHMQKHCPTGYRVKTQIVVSYVPDVNPYLKPEFRK